MDMKKLLAVSLTIMILGTLGGCGKQDTQEPPKVEIDYGNSELYTQEDMDGVREDIESGEIGPPRYFRFYMPEKGCFMWF